MDTLADAPDNHTDKEKISKILAHCKLQYVQGGNVVSALSQIGSPSRTLETMLKLFDYAAINEEFSRALANVETKPKEAVSAASNILESLCKLYIVDNGLEMLAKQDLKPLWTTVRKHLGFDPSILADQDLQTILTGLFATVEGIGALRTHASSAHGAGKVSYRIEPRHARLAIHASHTVTLFALETWDKRKKDNATKN
jgi:hypothetical protein